MSYSGWVPYRRGIIQHVLDGRLTGLEHYALSQLILVADAATGGYNINAPLLCYYTGHVFNQDTGQRVLNRLHEKKYIWYKGKPFSKTAQPYWINRYLLTRGPYKARMTRLDELFEKSTISQQDVWNLADEGAGERTDEGAGERTDEGADNNKKEKETDTKKRDSSLGTGVSASMHDSMTAAMNAEAKRTSGPGVCASKSASLSASRAAYAPPAALVVATPLVSCEDAPFTWGDPIPGCRFLTGAEPYYECIATGKRLEGWWEAQQFVNRIRQKVNAESL
jgi:hypothetical protein